MSSLRRVLVVDDSLINRRILCKILSDEYDTIPAANGQEALELLQKYGEAISLVLLDIVMPVMDGYTLLSLLTKDPLFGNIPIIIATHRDSEEDEVKALANGATDFITKPYKAKVIKNRVASIIKLRETAAMINLMKYDRLTGLYSKEFFYQRAGGLIEQNPQQPYDIVCSDIENFKLVNDMFGVKVGDELLRHVATLSKVVAGGHGICGRLGADTFVALMDHREDYSQEMFQRIVSRMNEFHPASNLTMKFGIFMIQDRSLPIDQICDRAMLAANSIKGKYSQYFAYYDDTLRDKLLSEKLITESMERGLQEKQFQVYLQPKYNLRNNKIAGAEALVRWIHPEKGYMSPGEFIPLFERNGFIRRLDEYIWRETCAIMRDWREQGIPFLPISVNVSRADIYNTDLPEVILNIVKEYGLEPKHLHLEITESAYTDNPNQIIDTVKILRNYGFIIEMDDFGTGYSSLNMLSELPIDVLKLDMRFLQSESRRNKNHNVLSFIVSLARWMNLLVIAEGVETEEQVNCLRDMDCNYVQGYYFAKPMPPAQLTSMLMHVDDMDDSCTHSSPMSLNVEILKSNQFMDKVIVVVDDIQRHRQMIQHTFHPYCTVVEANNGVAALPYIREHADQVAVILLDLIMPLMDGFQLLNVIKNDETMKDIPVIITSQGGKGSEERAIDLGADGFISKPYSTKLLLHHVQTTVANATLKKQSRLLEENQLFLQEAFRDFLTGFLNRRGLNAAVNELSVHESDTLHALYILDIDNLKECNDKYGHACGDQVLTQFSDVLRAETRSDDIIARMGGDEFVVILKKVASPEHALKKGQRLCQTVQAFSNEDGTCPLSCSIGVAMLHHGHPFKEIMRRADQALYTAKKTKKGSCCLWDGDWN